MVGDKRIAAAVFLLAALSAAESRAASQLMDYFLPTPIVGSLSSTCWGAAQVGPRDQSNGLEDKTLAKWVYWDGGIIKAPDGVYHMFSSRWDQSNGHGGWQCCSYAVHSTSNNLFGPYTDQGTFYTFDGGKGHNVTPFPIANGQYGVSISGVRPGHVFTATSLNGPWTDRGDLVVNGSFCTQCNLKILYRPDGKYEAIESEGKLALASDVAGPYTVQGASFYGAFSNSIPDISKLEDPTIWYSGGKYHWLTNQWAIKKAFHFTSADGISNWKLDQGYAYDPTQNFVRYTDGTVNHWAHVERPEVYIEGDHVVAFTFAAINVDKDQDVANDRNGSKVIVVPFDGATFDSGGVPGSGGAGGASGSSGAGGRGGNGGGAGAAGSAGRAGSGAAGGGGGASGLAGAGVAGSSGTGGRAGTGAGGGSGGMVTSSGGSAPATGGAGGRSATGGSVGSGGSAGMSADGCSCGVGHTPAAHQRGGVLLLLGLWVVARARESRPRRSCR